MLSWKVRAFVLFNGKMNMQGLACNSGASLSLRDA
jgi:hypothetical protein